MDEKNEKKENVTSAADSGKGNGRHIYQNLLYLTQFGLNLALPPILFLWLGNWLKGKFDLGNWVMILALVLGIGTMLNNLLVFLQQFARRAKKETPERISYNKRW